MPEGILESYSRLTQVCQCLVNAVTVHVKFQVFEYATYRDLARGMTVRTESWKPRPVEAIGSVNQETQANRNHPCRESCCCLRENSTKAPTVDARRQQPVGLQHQPIDRRRTRRGG
jgi:hypothetical protein